jgi:hypothetical protein
MSTKQCLAVMQFLLPRLLLFSSHCCQMFFIGQFRLIQTLLIGSSHRLGAYVCIKLTPPPPVIHCHTGQTPYPHPKLSIYISLINQWCTSSHPFFSNNVYRVSMSITWPPLCTNLGITALTFDLCDITVTFFQWLTSS